MVTRVMRFAVGVMAEHYSTAYLSSVAFSHRRHRMSLRKRRIAGLGWKPQLPDTRDFKFAAPARVRIPIAKDLTTLAYYPPAYDQKSLGSCTANALGGAFEFENAKQGHTSYIPSRLFLYYGERLLENSIAQDAGAELRDGAKVLAKLGAPHESLWRYSVSKFATKPPAKAYADGLLHLATSYKAIDNSTATPTLAAIASGTPVVFGFTAYAALESDAVDQSGILPMPGPNDAPIGGHACALVGFRQDAKMMLVRNSWGANWSAPMKGHFWMPMSYCFSQLAADFWIISGAE